MSKIWREAPRLAINESDVRASFSQVELGPLLGTGAEAIVFEDATDPTKALKFRAIDVTKEEEWEKYYQSIISDRPTWYQRVDSFEIRPMPFRKDYKMICVKSEKLNRLASMNKDIAEIYKEAHEFERRLNYVVSYWDLGDHNIMIDQSGNFKMIDGDPSMTWTYTSF